MRFIPAGRYEWQETPFTLPSIKRSMKRQQDRLPLLGPLIAEKQGTPEEWRDRQEVDSNAFAQAMRDDRARRWREARRELAGLGNMAPLVREYWQVHRWLPGLPEHLAALIGSVKRGRITPENLEEGIARNRETTARVGPVHDFRAPRS